MAMHHTQTLQSEYLTHLIKHQKPVTLHFKSGYKITGILTGMTDQVIFFKHGITEYFYKNIINSIIPITQYTIKA